jgi:heme o synthase
MATATQISAAGSVSTALPRDYFELLKPRVMSLVVFTAAVGMLAAPGALPVPVLLAALLAIAIGAGASGALNMWFDSDIDAKMERTAARPIPSGRVSPAEALAFGLVLSGFSIATLGLLANWTAAGLLAFTIFFYAVIYTMWLKRTTPQNIVIGGAAGALPPVIGWAAVAGHTGLEPWLMFAVIFLWTPPHFWALALLKSDDYERAGIPMLPNVAGARVTRQHILAYTVATSAVALAPWIFGFAGTAYAILAGLLGMGFIRHGWAVFAMGEGPDMRPAGRMFGYSIFYLFALFCALAADALFAGVTG